MRVRPFGALWVHISFQAGLTDANLAIFDIAR